MKEFDWSNNRQKLTQLLPPLLLPVVAKELVLELAVYLVDQERTVVRRNIHESVPFSGEAIVKSKSRPRIEILTLWK